MKFFSFSKKENKKVALVYDIGSASVGGALVVYAKNEVPKIIYSVRKDIGFQEDFNVKRFHLLVTKAIDGVCADMQKNGLPHLKFTKLGDRVPKSILVALSSPWYALQTRVIKISEKEPFLITEKKVSKWIEKEVDSFKSSDEVKKYEDEGGTMIIEKQITKIKLNGYETTSPYGKSAKTFEAAITVSVSPQRILDDIYAEIRRSFSSKFINFNAFPMASFSVIRDMSDNEDFIFLDISGELTDVLVSKQGVPLEVITFPMGKNNILRKLSQELGTSKDEATSLLSLHSEDKLDGMELVRVGNALNKVRSEWVMLFQKTLEEISEEFSVPSTVFFTSGADLSKWFEKSIKAEQFSQFTMSNSPFSVISVDSSFLSKNVKVMGNMKSDPFLMINSIFFNKLI